MTDIIYVFRENGTTLCTSHVGDPAWDTPENRRRTFDFITRHAEAERERPRALLIQDLAAETRRADSAESKLRETTGELEKADKAIQFHVRAYDLEQARFRKATALLERLAVAWTESAPANEAVRDAYAFLSRIPSPPIALPADGEPGRIGGRDVPRPALQPACHQVCHGDCHWGLPDAPAPLDVHIAVGPEAIDEVLAQPAAPEPSSPYPDTSAAWHWEQRAEAAEARLAAVQAELKAANSDRRELADHWQAEIEQHAELHAQIFRERGETCKALETELEWKVALVEERAELLSALQLQQNTSLAMADELTEAKALLRAFWKGADSIRHGRVVFEWFKSYGEDLNETRRSPTPGTGEKT